MNVTYAARWKHWTQKSCKKWPSVQQQHCTTLWAYVFAIKSCIDNRKKTC